MLKINLLPNRRAGAAAEPSADSGRIFAIALVGTLAVLVAGLFLFHSSKVRELEQARTANNTVENQVRTIRARVADHQQIRDNLAEIRAREEAIGHLEAARTGPTAMLVELSHLLAPGGRPTIDPALLDRIQHENPTQMFNTTWDPHRLWVSRFSEENRQVVIEGSGRTADDVGEFMRRMMLSQYFDQVRLERSESGQDEATKISVQRFKITARVRY
jgi:type IV pilus assembly protein PilN